MRLLRLIACLVTLVLVGCGSTVVGDQAGPPASTAVGDQAGPPPVTLADTSPAKLDVMVGVNIGGYIASERGTTDVAIQFMSQGRLISFQDGETLACNGAEPARLTTGIDQIYPTSSVAGKLFTCTYQSGQRSALLQFRVPPAATILMPTEGTAIERSSATLVHFQAEGTIEGIIEGIVALGGQTKAVAQIIAPGIASVDTSHLAPGPGQITLTQFPLVADTSGAAFASLRANCTAMSSVDIVWR